MGLSAKLAQNQPPRKSREIMIGPRAHSILALLLLKAGASGRVFPIRRDSLRQAINWGYQRAGVPSWSRNTLRHTSASQIRREFDPDTARSVVAHSKANMTEHYALLDQRKAAEVAKRIG
jgi:integrase